MNITRFDTISEHDLLARIGRTRLMGHDQYPIYEASRLTVAQMDTDELAPAQRYVLDDDVRRVHSLRSYFLKSGVDIFALRGGLLFWYLEDDGSEEGPVPLVPPVIEESYEPDGRTVLIINDGMHRIFAAREAGCSISVVLAREVPRSFPYYALALPDGWAGVERLAAIPDGYKKKSYRDPNNYKALFRDFNAVLPGVQKQRKRGIVE
jgi:hypothetical protein